MGGYQLLHPVWSVDVVGAACVVGYILSRERIIKSMERWALVDRGDMSVFLPAVEFESASHCCGKELRSSHPHVWRWAGVMRRSESREIAE
jgi:hypothetical protein